MLFLAAGLGLVFWLLQRDCRDECCLSFDGGNGEYLHYAHRAGGLGGVALTVLGVLLRIWALLCAIAAQFRGSRKWGGWRRWKGPRL